ncbi:hypothetical protein [Thermococcus thioreducens]|uniref:Uncharacterized protein n=1 Tax=Thermococcus thioreducens TaxID=277988 RepID=A0A1I0NSE7_9EURY|nr:hypothetical protein [Thermococcus thioreducens]SEW04544.1 hypothetical protein SAMN05216170_1227 [Thermococcus thioreducens]
MDKKHRSNPGDGEFSWEHLLIKLGGKEYLRLKRILEDVKKNGIGKKAFLLALQVPLLSAQEEIGLVPQLLRNVV